MDTRAAVAAYVETHRDASHRDLARALGVSASSIDRACRTLRQATRSQCPHSREAASDAACVTQPTHAKARCVSQASSYRSGCVTALTHPPGMTRHLIRRPRPQAPATRGGRAPSAAGGHSLRAAGAKVAGGPGERHRRPARQGNARQVAGPAARARASRPRAAPGARATASARAGAAHAAGAAARRGTPARRARRHGSRRPTGNGTMPGPRCATLTNRKCPVPPRWRRPSARSRAIWPPPATTRAESSAESGTPFARRPRASRVPALAALAVRGAPAAPAGWPPVPVPADSACGRLVSGLLRAC